MPVEERPLALSAVVFANRYPRRRIVLTVGRTAIIADVSATPEAVTKGLSGRTTLNDGEGMLFVMRSADRHPFWMRGTTVPLSIAYIADDGTIQEIRDLEPLSEQSVRPEIPARIMLEVPKGWFERKGVGVGARVSIGR